MSLGQRACVFGCLMFTFSISGLFLPQAFSRSSYPGAVSQEKRKKGDGGERDPEYQEAFGQNGLQGPPQLQDYGKPWSFQEAVSLA